MPHALHRRSVLALLGTGICIPLRAGHASAAEGRATAFGFERAEGGALPLSAYSGRPILVVNTATACGYAGQLSGLQALWTRFEPRGLAVIGVPSADFGNQEPLDGAAIAEAARRNHGVAFPLATKTRVKMPGAHPFYAWAAGERPGETPRWNFHKYLITRDGTLANAFPSGVEPSDPRLVSAVAAALDKA